MSAEASRQPIAEYVPDQGRSALFIACASMGGLLCVLAVSVFLFTTFGAMTACVGLIALFTLPLACYRLFEKRDASEGRMVARTPVDRLCVISFWCVSSLVLLMVATLAR